MANYNATTVSEGGKINDIQAVEALISKWAQVGGDGELTCEVSDNTIRIYGYDDFYIYGTDENGDTDYDDKTEDELKKLCPYIESPLIIKSVGSEKCRYVGAGAWIVSKEGVLYTSLDDAISAKISI